jgi:hypothetical protein
VQIVCHSVHNGGFLLTSRVITVSYVPAVKALGAIWLIQDLSVESDIALGKQFLEFQTPKLTDESG